MQSLFQSKNYYKNVHNVTISEHTKSNGDHVIQIRQYENDTDTYFTQQELLDIIDGLYVDIYEEYHKTAIAYYKIVHSVVTPKWLQTQKTRYKLKSKVIARELDINKGMVNDHHNGNIKMSNTIHAMYYYYYLSKEESRPIDSHT